MQDHLGDLNDANVAVQIIDAFIDARHSSEDEESLEVISEYLAARRKERRQLMESFPEAWERFNRAAFRRKLASALAIL